jgi:hypothetical protein
MTMTQGSPCLPMRGGAGAGVDCSADSAMNEVPLISKTVENK